MFCEIFFVDGYAPDNSDPNSNGWARWVGIQVMDPNLGLESAVQVVQDLIPNLEEQTLVGALWIVDENHVRIRRSQE